jgi:hypothetical protein
MVFIFLDFCFVWLAWLFAVRAPGRESASANGDFPSQVGRRECEIGRNGSIRVVRRRHRDWPRRFARLEGRRQLPASGMALKRLGDRR